MEENKSTPETDQNPQVENKLQPASKISRTFIYVLFAIIVLLLVTTTILAVQNRKVLQNTQSNITPTPPMEEIISTPTTSPENSVPTNTPTGISTPTKAASLFRLYIAATDYSDVEPTLTNPISRVTLFDSKGKLLGENSTTSYVENETGYAMFNVPFGTYRAEASSGTLIGDTTITIDSNNDLHHYAVPMYAKPIQVSGYYFYDENRNNQFDQNEKTFPNKRINVTVKNSRGNLYAAGETTTNNEGFYTITTKYKGSYTLYGTYENGYTERPANWIEASGGQSVTLHYFLWPYNY